MKVVTPIQMNEIDNITISEVGIPGIVLMENAAIKVVEEIVKYLGTIFGKEIIIIAGKGNNGGDAFAAARHLYNKGADIRVYIIIDKKAIGGDAAVNLGILENMGIPINELFEKKHVTLLMEKISDADIIVDGILGTGLKGNIKDNLKDVVEALNVSGKPIIAIDIPTGVNGETGEVSDVCIKATKTVTFGLPKLGLVVHPGCEYTGGLIIADIGLVSSVIDKMDIKINIIEKNFVAGLMPVRKNNSNKGDYGRVFIVSGSVGMTGAGCLAAGAALRSGAGLIYLGVPSSLTCVYDASLIESVTIPLEDNNSGYLAKGSLDRINEMISKSSVVAIGPGLSVNKDIIEIIEEIIEKSDKPIIMDADALNALSKDLSILGNLKTDAIITPHPGEMSRLLGISIEDVQNNRMKVATEFAIKWRVITVLKGSRTIVALPDGTIYINTTGNSGMATAGCGDVLTGIIAGLIGQGVCPSDAAVAGVYLHGLAGDGAVGIKGEHGMIARDLVEELPRVIKGLININRRDCYESERNNVHERFHYN